MEPVGTGFFHPIFNPTWHASACRELHSRCKHAVKTLKSWKHAVKTLKSWVILPGCFILFFKRVLLDDLYPRFPSLFFRDMYIRLLLIFSACSNHRAISRYPHRHNEIWCRLILHTVEMHRRRYRELKDLIGKRSKTAF